MATPNAHIPRLSVIMPVHNAELYLGEAIRSILTQDFEDFELILIDDGSSDGSLEVMRSFSDPRIRIHRHEKACGVASTMNEAFEMCRGEWVARMDADDVALPSRFSKQLQWAEKHPDLGVVCTRIAQIDIYGNPAGEWADDRDYITPYEIRQRMPFRNCLANPTFMMKADLARKYQYDTAFRVAEDYAYWLHLLHDDVSIGKVDEVLLHYRIHPSSLTQSDNRRNPHGRYLNFQWHYVKRYVLRNRFDSVHLLFLLGFFMNLLMYPWLRWVRPGLSACLKIWRANVPGLILDYLRLRRMLNQADGSDLFFFFPFYHVGGAERVHADIVQTVADHRSRVFFTKRSANEGFLSRFSHVAECSDIWRLCWFPVFRTMTARLIAAHINRQKNPVIFGCNSIFFYTLIPLLSPKVRVIDLIHAFMHPEEDGAEKWALPHLHRIDHRVVISRKTLGEMKEQLNRMAVDPILSERISFIRNYTPLVSDSLPEKPVQPFTVVYLGRGTAEKRLDWIADIAVAVHRLSHEVRFVLAGKELDESLPHERRQEFVFTGEITDDQKLMRLLDDSHVLLMTSAREGLPMVIMEAMARGVVPVCTAVGDIPNVILHDKNGYMITPDHRADAVEQAATLILQLSSDRGKWSAMSSAALKTAKHEFSEAPFREAYRHLLLR